MQRIYLDWNATAPLRPEAKAAAVEALDLFGNPSSVHEEGRRARRVREEARETVAGWLRVSPEAVTFTSGGTESNATALWGLASSVSGKPPVVAVSATEHPSVLESAKTLSRRGGAKLEILAVDRKGLIDTSVVREHFQITEPAVVSVHAANNETGVIQPVGEIAALARHFNARVHTDATQVPGRLAIPAGLWGADSVTFSGHKLGALKGVGLLVNPGRLALEPLLPGGPQERGRRAGTENIVAIASLGAAIKALMADEARELEHLKALDHLFLELLSSGSGGGGLILNSGDAPRLPNTWNIRLTEDAEPVLQALDLEGIAVSSGSACSSGSVEPSPVLLAMGLGRDEARASLRVSAGRTTRPDDLRRFFETLGRIRSRSR